MSSSSLTGTIAANLLQRQAPVVKTCTFEGSAGKLEIRSGGWVSISVLKGSTKENLNLLSAAKKATKQSEWVLGVAYKLIKMTPEAREEFLKQRADEKLAEPKKSRSLLSRKVRIACAAVATVIAVAAIVKLFPYLILFAIFATPALPLIGYGVETETQ